VAHQVICTVPALMPY